MSRKEIKDKLKEQGYIGTVRKGNWHSKGDYWTVKKISDDDCIMSGQKTERVELFLEGKDYGGGKWKGRK